MQSYISTLLLAILASACEIPDEPELSRNITEGFGIRVQNATIPEIHNRFLNLEQAGGGDQHLYLSPAGRDTFNMTLREGIIEWGGIDAVINGEVSLSPRPQG
jgi:hypothetical protein